MAKLTEDEFVARVLDLARAYAEHRGVPEAYGMPMLLCCIAAGTRATAIGATADLLHALAENNGECWWGDDPQIQKALLVWGAESARHADSKAPLQ